MKLKVCIICPHFPVMGYPCGAADFVEKLATNLQANCDVTVYTLNKLANQAHPFKVNIFKKNWNFFNIWSFAQEIRNSNFDIIDVQFESYMYGGSGAILLLPLFLSNKTKKVLTMHSESLPKWGGRLWRILQFSLFQKIVFYSEHFCKNAAKRFPLKEKKFSVSPFPSNITKAKDSHLKKILNQVKFGFNPDMIYLSYFGHLTENRGIEYVLEVLSELNNPRFHFIFIGQFDPAQIAFHRDILSLVNRLNLSEKVTFTGRLDEIHVSQIMQITNLAVLPFREGASFKNGSLAAYIGHQVPVLTTKGEQTEENLCGNKGIFFFDLEKKPTMLNKLREIGDRPEILSDAKKYIFELEQVYSWEHYIKNRLQIYESSFK